MRYSRLIGRMIDTVKNAKKGIDDSAFLAREKSKALRTQEASNEFRYEMEPEMDLSHLDGMDEVMRNFNVENDSVIRGQSQEIAARLRSDPTAINSLKEMGLDDETINLATAKIWTPSRIKRAAKDVEGVDVDVDGIFRTPEEVVNVLKKSGVKNPDAVFSQAAPKDLAGGMKEFVSQAIFNNQLATLVSSKHDAMMKNQPRIVKKTARKMGVDIDENGKIVDLKGDTYAYLEELGRIEKQDKIGRYNRVKESHHKLEAGKSIGDVVVRAFKTPLLTADDLYSKAAVAGFSGMKEHVKKFYNHVSNSFGMDKGIRNITTRIVAGYSARSESKQRAIRQYIETREMGNVVDDYVGGVNVQVDMRAKQVVENAHGVVLDSSDIKFANNITMSMNGYWRANHRAKAGAMNPNDLPDFDALDGRLDNLDTSVYTSGGLGTKYHPALGSDEFLERLAARRGATEDGESIEILKDEMQKFNGHLHKPGDLESAIRQDWRNRRSPIEEIENYERIARSAIVKRNGDRFIRDIRNAASIQVAMKRTASSPEENISRTIFKEEIDSLEKKWSDAMTRKRRFEELGKAEQAGVSAVDTISAAYISGLANPSKPFFNVFRNSLQALSTSAIHKGVLTSIGNVTKNNFNFAGPASKALFDGLRDAVKRGEVPKDYIGQAVLDYAKKNPRVGRSLKRYMKEHIEDSAGFDKDVFTLSNESEIFNRVLSKSTMPFQLSDLKSRVDGFTIADAVFKKAERRQYRGLSDAEIEKRLHKEFGLYEFDGVSYDELWSMVDIDAVRKGTWFDSPEGAEFFYRYAKDSVMLEFFDYSRYGKPGILSAAATHGGLIGQTVRFKSWNIHYANLMATVHRSWQNGDKLPALRALAVSSMWLGAFGAAARALADRDTDGVFDFGGLPDYMLRSTPVIAPAIGLMRIPYDPLGGMTVDALWPAAASASIATSSLMKAVTGKDHSSLTYGLPQLDGLSQEDITRVLSDWGVSRIGFNIGEFGAKAFQNFTGF